MRRRSRRRVLRAAQQPEAATADATANNEDVVDADFKEVKRG